MNDVDMMWSAENVVRIFFTIFHRLCAALYASSVFNIISSFNKLVKIAVNLDAAKRDTRKMTLLCQVNLFIRKSKEFCKDDGNLTGGMTSSFKTKAMSFCCGVRAATNDKNVRFFSLRMMMLRRRAPEPSGWTRGRRYKIYETFFIWKQRWRCS